MSTTSSALTASRPRLLFTGPFARRDGAGTNYDVSPDGLDELRLVPAR